MNENGLHDFIFLLTYWHRVVYGWKRGFIPLSYSIVVRIDPASYKKISITREYIIDCSPVNHRLRAKTWLNRHQNIIFSASVDYLFPCNRVWRRYETAVSSVFHCLSVVYEIMKAWRRFKKVLLGRCSGRLEREQKILRKISASLAEIL